MTEHATHTPTPWFLSGVRFRMNNSEWFSINRYDEQLKQDENIACVGYDPRTHAGHADAVFIVRAVNSHAQLVEALRDATAALYTAQGALHACGAIEASDNICKAAETAAAALRAAGEQGEGQ